MVLYRIVLMPMVESIYCSVPGTVTPWYANNKAIAGPLPKIVQAFSLLKKLAPCQNYFPEPEKSVYASPARGPAGAASPAAVLFF
jgi:hypothetical protein